MNPVPNTAIVLAGGYGTRLRAVLPGHPKVLAPVGGVPLLHYLLSYLSAEGIGTVILCTGYLAEQIRSFSGDGDRWNLEIFYSEEERPLGTGGALRQAVARLSEPFFALNGDTLFLADLESLWQTHISRDVAATLALLPAEDGRDRGCISLEDGWKITAFDEKPVDAQNRLINAGVYVLGPDALSSIPLGKAASLEREVFPVLAQAGRLAGQVQKGYFMDIGTPETLAAFEADVQAERVPQLLLNVKGSNE